MMRGDQLCRIQIENHPLSIHQTRATSCEWRYVHGLGAFGLMHVQQHESFTKAFLATPEQASAEGSQGVPAGTGICVS